MELVMMFQSMNIEAQFLLLFGLFSSLSIVVLSVCLLFYVVITLLKDEHGQRGGSNNIHIKKTA